MDQIILGAIALIAIALFTSINQLQNSIRYMHKRLDSIAQQLGVEEIIDQDALSEIHTLLADGKRNKAIKMYRQVTGVGLKEAFDAIQLIEKKRTSR